MDWSAPFRPNPALRVGDWIAAGTGNINRDVGRVSDVDGSRITVAWESGVTTAQPQSALTDLVVYSSRSAALEGEGWR